MGNDGSVIIDVELNQDGVDRGIQETERSFSSLSDEAVSFAGKAAAGIAAAGFAFTAFSIKAAGDMQALSAQFEQSFDGLGDAPTVELTKLSDKFNILPNRLKGPMAQINSFFKGSGVAAEDSLGMTTDAMNIAADSAAFYDTSIEETSASLKGFLMGNFENGDAIGINTNLTKIATAYNEKYGGSFDELNDAAKQKYLLEYVQTVQKASGVTGQGVREMNGLENVMGNMKQTVNDLAAAFGTPFLEPFLNVVSAVSKGMSNLAQKLTENPALVYAVAGAVGTLVTAFGAVFLVAKKATILKGIETGFAAMTSPIFLVVLAIGALVTAFVYFYKSSEGFRNSVNSVIDSLKKFTAPLDDVIKGIGLLTKGFIEMMTNGPGPEIARLREQFLDLLPESVWRGMIKFASKLNDLKAGIQGIGKIVTGSITSLSELGDFLGGSFTEQGEKNIMAIGNAIKSVIGWFKNLINPAKQAGEGVDALGIVFLILKSVFLALLGPIGLFIKGFELIAKALGGGDVQKGVKSIVDSFGGLAKGIKSNSSQVGKSVGELIEGILGAIAGALPGIINGGLLIIGGIIKGLAQGLPQLALAATQLILAFTGAMLMLIPTIVISATTIILAFLGALTAELPKLVVAGLELIGALIAGLIQGLPQYIESVVNLITTFLNSLAENIGKIIDAGTNLLVNFLQGIINNLPKVIETVATLIITFLDEVVKKLPQLIESGANLIITWLQGIAKHLPDIITAAVDVIVAFLQGISENLQRIIDAAVEVVVSFIQGIADAIPRLADAAMDIVDGLVDAIIKIVDRMAKAAIALMEGLAKSIRDNREDMKAAGADLLAAILEGIPGYGLFEKGKELVGGLMDGIGDIGKKIGGVIDSINPFSRSLNIQANGPELAAPAAFSSPVMARSAFAMPIAAENFALPKMTAESVIGTSRMLNPSFATNRSTKPNKNNNKLAKERDSKVTIEIPVVVDGRNIAKASATFMKSEIDKIESREARLRGDII